MSWLKENYEKAALGGAAVIALGVGALILTGSAGEVKEEQNPTRVSSFDVPEQAELGVYVSALEKTGTVEQPQHLETDVYSFIAYPIYGVKGTPGLVPLDPDTLFHEIPLKWWKGYGMDDYQFSGAADKDNDDDGFTNKEEFANETNPVDAKSHPDLIEKLKLVNSKKTQYRIQWSFVDAERANMTFTLGRRTTYDICRVGDTFPTKDQPKEFLNRFKVKAKGKGPNPATNSEEEFFEIEDTKKDIPSYKLWRSDGPTNFLDWTVQLQLDTPNGGKAFEVSEGGVFSLPYKEGGKGYKFKLDPNRDPKLKKIERLEIEGKNGVVPLGLAPPEPVQEQPSSNSLEGSTDAPSSELEAGDIF